MFTFFDFCPMAVCMAQLNSNLTLAHLSLAGTRLIIKKFLHMMQHHNYMMQHYNCNWPLPVYDCLVHLCHTPSTDGSLLYNNCLCSAVNDLMLDNSLQSLMQTTTLTITDNP